VAVEAAVRLEDRLVARCALRVGAEALRLADAACRVLQVRPVAGADAGRHRRAVGAALARAGDRADVLVEHVGHGLQPQRVVRAAAGGDDPCAVQPRVHRHGEDLAQVQHDALDHAAREVGELVHRREADPRPGRLGRDVRRPLAQQVGEEQQAFGAGRRLARQVDEPGVVELAVHERRQRVAQPLERAACAQ
jgi:hypothetical protein